MATSLVVRNVEPYAIQVLKQVAAAHGRSAEAEHREILRSVLCRPARRSFSEFLAKADPGELYLSVQTLYPGEWRIYWLSG